MVKQSVFLCADMRQGSESKQPGTRSTLQGPPPAAYFLQAGIQYEFISELVHRG